MKIFSLILCSIIIISCQSKQNDIDKSKIGKIKKVLILGNSILRHAPNQELGWNNDWGMAATVADSDFLHILSRDIHAKNPLVKISSFNISDFERAFSSFNYHKLDSLINPDMLIIKIAENVDTLKETEFLFQYDKLLKYVDNKNNAVKIIVDGFWWRNLNRKLEKYALENNYHFISINSLSSDSSNMAFKHFTNWGVQIHPSDKGMRLIAERIWGYVGNYYQ